MRAATLTTGHVHTTAGRVDKQYVCWHGCGLRANVFVAVATLVGPGVGRSAHVAAARDASLIPPVRAPRPAFAHTSPPRVIRPTASTQPSPAMPRRSGKTSTTNKAARRRRKETDAKATLAQADEKEEFAIPVRGPCQ